MHSTVIFVEGFSTSRLEQWFQASQVLSRIICMAKGFCSWHLTNSYDEQLQYAATLAKRDTIFLSRPRAMSSSLGRLFSSETAPGSRKPVKPNKKDRHWHNWHKMDSSTHLRCNTTVPIEKEHQWRFFRFQPLMSSCAQTRQHRLQSSRYSFGPTKLARSHVRLLL